MYSRSSKNIKLLLRELFDIAQNKVAAAWILYFAFGFMAINNEMLVLGM
jgi:hypothetical protein